MSADARGRAGAGAGAAAAIDRLAGWLARHWLAVFNAVVAVFVGLPFLAPVLMETGAAGPARLLYAVYRPTCHQLPERSFFLFGPHWVYSPAGLEALGALPPGLDIFQREVLRLVGTPATGYKVAICQRDVAIYGAILSSGLLYAALRSWLRRGRPRMPKLPLWLYGVTLLPLAVDGITQLVGLRESTWLLRLATGGLFGAATVWLAYPYVEDAMADVIGADRRAVAENARPETGQKPGFTV